MSVRDMHVIRQRWRCELHVFLLIPSHPCFPFLSSAVVLRVGVVVSKACDFFFFTLFRQEGSLLPMHDKFIPTGISNFVGFFGKRRVREEERGEGAEICFQGKPRRKIGFLPFAKWLVCACSLAGIATAKEIFYGKNVGEEIYTTRCTITTRWFL